MTFIDYMGKNVIEQRTAVNVLLVVALPILSKTVFRMKAWKKTYQGCSTKKSECFNAEIQSNGKFQTALGVACHSYVSTLLDGLEYREA